MDLITSTSVRSARGLPSVLAHETVAVAKNLRRSWRVLRALAIIECRRKYAGSILGVFWYPLWSVLLLGSDCFVCLG